MVNLHSLALKFNLQFFEFFSQAFHILGHQNQVSAYRISFIKPSPVPSITTPTTNANSNSDNTDPWCTPTFTRNLSSIFFPGWLCLSYLDRGLSLPLPFYLVKFSFSLPIPSLFLGLYQKLFPNQQNTCTTFFLILVLYPDPSENEQCIHCPLS